MFFLDSGEHGLLFLLVNVMILSHEKDHKQVEGEEKRKRTSMQMMRSWRPLWTWPRKMAFFENHRSASPEEKMKAMITPCHQVTNTTALNVRNFANGLIA